MPNNLESFVMSRTPTADRPLLGLTVLVVEDSRYACEAMRLLCLRSGARIRRANSLKSARRHLSIYRPAVAIIDLGLPDGSGTDLIDELCRATPRPEVVLGISGDVNAAGLAKGAGADGFFEKPIESLAAFQQTILSHLPSHFHSPGLRLVADDIIDPDPLALRDDLAHISDLLTTSALDDKAIAYIAQFLAGVARIAHDKHLAAAATVLAEQRRLGRPITAEIARVAGMVHDRLRDDQIV